MVLRRRERSLYSKVVDCIVKTYVFEEGVKANGSSKKKAYVFETCAELIVKHRVFA